MVLDEGKNREIRRMLANLGHKVHQLKRVAVGTLTLGNLLPGQWRQLAWSEIEALRKDAIAAVGAGAERQPPRRGEARGGPPRRGFRGRPEGRPPRRPTGRPGGGTGGAGGRQRKRPGKASQWRSRPSGQGG